MDRQVYYRHFKRLEKQKKLAQLVIDLVIPIRTIMPRIGGKKLYYLLEVDLRKINVGRDKLFTILKANNMLIRPKKTYHITTNSHHRFRKHKNQIKEKIIYKPEQVWVSDITYIGKREKPCYLALITDAYSKKVIGYNVSNSLSVDGSLKALELALKNRKYKYEKPLIHHSDRGLQYCSNEYQRLLRKNKILPSMTEQYDPYENAVAERVNGILKQEFDIDKYNHLGYEMKKKIAENAIKIYNNYRPHYSNFMMTPSQMHLQSKIKMRTYKKKKGNNNQILLPLN